MYSQIRAKRRADLFNVDDCIAWLATSVYAGSFEVWARKVMAFRGVKDVTSLLAMTENFWPGTICLGHSKDHRMGSEHYVSLSFLMDIRNEDFLEYCYALLLNRLPDKDGLASLEPLVSMPDGKQQIVDTIITSDEYCREERPILIDAREERILNVHYEMARKTVFYRAARFQIDFFSGDAQPFELCLAWEETVLIHSSNDRIVPAAGMRLYAQPAGGGALHCEPGWIFSGPKAKIRAGQFKVFVHIDAEPSVSLHMDFVGEHGTRILSVLKFVGSMSSTIVCDISDQVEDFEVRLLNTGPFAGRVTIRSLSILRISK